MVYLKKVLIVKLPNGTVNLIPLEEISECKIIIPNDKLGIWVHEETTPGGSFDGLEDHNKVRDLSNEDIENILKDGGQCLIEVNYFNKLRMPTSYNGDKKVVLHLKIN